LALLEIQTERHARTADSRADRVERRVRRQRFESDDEMSGAELDAALCAIDRADSGVEPERYAEPGQPAHQVRVRRLRIFLSGISVVRDGCAEDCVEVGSIQRIESQSIDVDAGER